MLEAGGYIAVALVIVEVVLIFSLVWGKTTKGVFAIVSPVIIFAAAFFWMGDRVTEMTIRGVGTIRTAVNIANQYVEDIRKIKSEIDEQRKTIATQITQLAKLTADEKRAECVLSQMTSRHISPDQRASLVSKLAAFPGIVVNAWRFTGTPGSQSVVNFELEKMRFAGELTDVFQTANWKTNGVIVRQNQMPDVRQSVFIMQRQGADSRIDKAVKALVAGLDADCIKVNVGPPFPGNGDYGQQIFIDSSGAHPDTVQADIVSPVRPQKNPDISILVGVALQSW